MTIFTQNGDYGYLRSEIISKTAVWTYSSEEVKQYDVEYDDV